MLRHPSYELIRCPRLYDYFILCCCIASMEWLPAFFVPRPPFESCSWYTNPLFSRTSQGITPPQTRAMQSNCYTRTYDLSNNSIWCPAFRSLIKKCFWKIVKRVPISWTRTASSNSNARTSVNESAFNLKITNHSSGYPLTLEMETYSTRENLYAIHPCDPPRNISMLPHTPGIALISAGISFNQNTGYTYFNSRVSFLIMPPTD